MNQQAKASGPITLTREELYELAWETPMSRLSEGFGLSDNGLAKICRRLDIPCPPRGYWAKLAAGKKVKATALPKAKPGIPSSATIYRKGPTKLAELAPDLAASLSAAMKKVGTIRVPERLHKPHAIVAGWLAEQQRQIELAKRDRWSSHYRPRDFTPMDRRRHRLLERQRWRRLYPYRSKVVVIADSKYRSAGCAIVGNIAKGVEACSLEN